jgi:hypothetical protein
LREKGTRDSEGVERKWKQGGRRREKSNSVIEGTTDSSNL